MPLLVLIARWGTPLAMCRVEGYPAEDEQGVAAVFPRVIFLGATKPTEGAW